MKPAFTLGLRGRMILLLVAAFAGLASVIVAQSLHDRSEMISAASEQLMGQAKLIAARQQFITARGDALLSSLLLHPELGAAAPADACPPLLSDMLKQQTEFINIAQVRPDGALACSAVPDAGPLNFPDRVWFQQALQTREMVVGDVVTGRVIRKPVLSFAKAMRDGAGHVTGVFFVSLEIAWLERELAKGKLPQGARLMVVDDRGMVAVHNPDPEGWAGRSIAHQPLFKHIRAEHVGEDMVEGTGLDGVRRLYAHAPLLASASGRKYHLLLGVPKAVIMAPAQRDLAVNLGLALLIFAGALALVVVGGNRLVLRPLLALSRTAARLGAGDLAARSGLPHTDDEIGRLARELDEGGDHLQTSERKLKRANRALRTLSACNLALVHAQTEEELLQNVCRHIVETGGYRVAFIGFAGDDAEKTVSIAAQHGAEAGYLESLGFIWADTDQGQGTVGRAIRSGAPQVSQNIMTDPKLAAWRVVAARLESRASISLPFKWWDGKVFGMLTILAAEADAFDAGEIELLTELADGTAFGIGTLRTRAERDRITYAHVHHAEILQKSLEQSIQAIADTVEARDPYTAGHQRRVSELAVAIARELGLPEEKIHGIHLAAIIHDLGKIQVPAEILTKPGKLSDIEFMLMKTHPQAGYDILKDVDFPWPIADIVRQHHERLDGSGYPQGLKDGQILLESRIMAVADVVEAMASHRPYRPTLGIEAALQEIERGRGRAYDPAVVDACLKLFREGRFALEG